MDSTDVTEDLYAVPVANAGLVEVYLSTKGKYVRATVTIE